MRIQSLAQKCWSIHVKSQMSSGDIISLCDPDCNGSQKIEGPHAVKVCYQSEFTFNEKPSQARSWHIRYIF